HPAIRCELTVSKGYYVRSFARDLGRSLGCPAHLCELTRTRCGDLLLGDAAPLDASEELLRGRIMPLAQVAERHFVTLRLGPDDELLARRGLPIDCNAKTNFFVDPSNARPTSPLALLDATGQRLIAMASKDGDRLVVTRGFNDPVP